MGRAVILHKVLLQNTKTFCGSWQRKQGEKKEFRFLVLEGRNDRHSSYGKQVIMQNEEDRTVNAMSLHREGGGGFSQELQ